jgi:prolyl-tRNA synthetase
MRQSFLFTKTRKEAPKDEVAQNAKLLIRAGFIHKELAGVYSYLPLGLRVMEKIVGVIREEMNAIGGQEVTLTALQDKKVWETSGRWDDSVLDVWFKTKLKNDTELGLGTTHEEQLTALMKDYIASYRDLPRYVYQFQTKFRNETRAKSGIMRGREFVMKDLYSFSADQETHDAFYEKAKQAYSRIFARLGLGDRTYVTFASGGSFSKYSHEFQTVTDAGEDSIFIDIKTKEAWNKEVATGVPDDKNSSEKAVTMKEVDAQRKNSIEASCALHKCEPWAVLKSFVFKTEKGDLGIACIRGDLEVNELLLSHVVEGHVRAATSDELKAAGLVQGFISPVNISSKYVIYGDESLKTVKNFNTGANAQYKDCVGVNLDRDFKVSVWGNYAVPNERYKSPHGNQMKIEKAVEVGNIFSLGTRFSDAFELNFVAQDGSKKPVIMGSYGIGPGRFMGTLAEVLSDKDGLVWPEVVSPFKLHLIALFDKEGKVRTYTDALYQRLTEQGVEVLYDDRDQRAGEKFADADLIGIPYRAIVSDKTLGEKVVEFKDRKSGAITKILETELQKMLVKKVN